MESRPEQMKRLDVGSPQTQLSPRREGIASYGATQNKTHVGGSGAAGGFCQQIYGCLLQGLQVPGAGLGEKERGREDVAQDLLCSLRNASSSIRLHWHGVASSVLHSPCFKAEALDS